MPVAAAFFNIFASQTLRISLLLDRAIRFWIGPQSGPQTKHPKVQEFEHESVVDSTVPESSQQTTQPQPWNVILYMEAGIREHHNQSNNLGGDLSFRSEELPPQPREKSGDDVLGRPGPRKAIPGVFRSSAISRQPRPVGLRSGCLKTSGRSFLAPQSD